MLTFEQFLNEDALNEKVRVADVAREMMASGKYDPAVRGNATRFKEDIKKTGITQSNDTAHDAWIAHKHLHPKSATSAPAPAAKPAPTSAPKAVKHEPGFEDAKKLADHARTLGYNAKVRHDGHEHTVALGWDWDKHRNAGKLDDFIHKHKLYHVGLAAEVHGAKVKTVY